MRQLAAIPQAEAGKWQNPPMDRPLSGTGDQAADDRFAALGFRAPMTRRD
jgi:hypothetical protein